MSDLPALPRAPLGWMTLTARLAHLSVVTWRLPPARLRSLRLPDGLTPFCLDGDALISAVTFCNQDFRPAWLPLPGLSLGQTNYRLYVHDPAAAPDHGAVFFVGTTIDTAAVFLPRRLWRMPWRRARYRFSADPDAQRLTVEARGVWPLHLRLSGVGAPLGDLPGFPSLRAGLIGLTQPHIGHYAAGRYTIWHDPYDVRSATLEAARFDLLDALGLVPFAEQPHPHSVLVTARAPTYLIYLPPTPRSPGP